MLTTWELSNFCNENADPELIPHKNGAIFGGHRSGVGRMYTTAPREPVSSEGGWVSCEPNLTTDT
jgi:hypothetical protein